MKKVVFGLLAVSLLGGLSLQAKPELSDLERLDERAFSVTAGTLDVGKGSLQVLSAVALPAVSVLGARFAFMRRLHPDKRLLSGTLSALASMASPLFSPSLGFKGVYHVKTGSRRVWEGFSGDSSAK